MDFNGSGGSNRRRFLTGLVSLGLLGASGCATRPTSNTAPPQAFVLVHGAWHGGWVWDLVRARLEAQGHIVLTPTLSGLGERSEELSSDITLQTHVADVIADINQSGIERFILVGHSYGGMVITGVADQLHARIDHLVYLDAAVPEDGQSMLTAGPARTPEEMARTRAALEALSEDGGLSMAVLPPEAFGIPSDHPRRDWVARQLTPHPLNTWFSPLSLRSGTVENVPRTFVFCTDPVLNPSSVPYFAARAKADRQWNYRELTTGHDAMVTAPSDVTDILLEMARMKAG